MSIVSAVVVFFLIWWLVLFTILPIGTRPDPDSDAESGWRGTPEAPRIWHKALITTLVSAVVFIGVYLLIDSDAMSFRSGIWAMPEK